MEAHRKFFKRKLYEDAFNRCYEKYQNLVTEIEEVCQEAEDRDAVIEELAAVIPEYVHRRINNQKSKSKRDGLMIDYNMTMVTFVVPILGYRKTECCGLLIDRMIEKWNKAPVTMRIGKSDFESLNKGFRSRLCYITTAVCRSRNQADDCYELNLLRDYRDTYLSATEEGKAVVEAYYDVAPTIVNRIDREQNSREIYEEIYQSYLKKCVGLIEADELEKCRGVYTDMVEELEKKYLYS